MQLSYRVVLPCCVLAAQKRDKIPRIPVKDMILKGGRMEYVKHSFHRKILSKRRLRCGVGACRAYFVVLPDDVLPWPVVSQQMRCLLPAGCLETNGTDP